MCYRDKCDKADSRGFGFLFLKLPSVDGSLWGLWFSTDTKVICYIAHINKQNNCWEEQRQCLHNKIMQILN